MRKNLSTPCRPVRLPTMYQGCRMTLDIPSGKPELDIYSQQEADQLGELLTWDNPDISTYRGPAQDEILRLDPLQARIRNLSEVAPATNALVHCDIGPFGIGTFQNRIATRMMTVMPEQEVEIKFPLFPDLLSGEQRLAVRITAEVPNDLNRINNVGEQTVAGGKSSGIGREPVFKFKIVNRTGGVENFTFSVLENQLSAEVVPDQLSLSAQEEAEVQLRCQVSDTLHGLPPDLPQRLDATVVCRTGDGRLYGGLTCFVFVDN